MTSDRVSAELSALCNALGYSTGTTYNLDPYVKESIRDLIRYLRRDEDDHSIRRHIGSSRILRTDLLPMLIHHSDNGELVELLVRLIVNLTNPALLIYGEELPADKNARKFYMEIVSHLQNYKDAFTDQKVWEILVKKLEALLNIPVTDRDVDDNRMIERILILVRNVLQVPSDSDTEKRPDNDASLHDQVLWCLHQSGMVDLLLYMASSLSEQQYYIHILEIVSLMLREQDPAALASAALQRSVQEKEKDEKELLVQRKKEEVEQAKKLRHFLATRHSRFGGTFVMKDVKSVSDKDIIYHKPLTKAVSLDLDFGKKRARVPKNKMALNNDTPARRSAFSVRLFLKEFCVEFLNGVYNALMRRIKGYLQNSKNKQPNDETYYLWAIKFFMEFNRLYHFKLKLVCETMNQENFYFIRNQIENWLAILATDKKHVAEWSKRIHTAVKAFKELLMTLMWMEISKDNDVRKSAYTIQSSIFYVAEYREITIFLFNVFNETKFSRGFLKDLVETTHIFMKMLERYTKNHRCLIVEGKKKKKTSKKKKAEKSKTEQNLEAAWELVAPELSAVLHGETPINPDSMPFDVTAGKDHQSEEDEMLLAMKNIKAHLMQNQLEQSIGYLRAARSIWPNDQLMRFGYDGIPAEEEFLILREIFMADIELPRGAEPVPEMVNEDETDGESEEIGVQEVAGPDSEFKFSDFVARFASPNVMEAVCLLLSQFEKNDPYTNKCIIKLLYRVARDCNMPQMLFQGSVFRAFSRAFESDNAEHIDHGKEDYREIARLGRYVVREFVKATEKEKRVFMEMLFWKNKQEAYEVEFGYGSSEHQGHASKNVWTEEQEDELRRLVKEFDDTNPEDQDQVTWVMNNMINQNRSRKAVMKKLRELYLLAGPSKPKKGKTMSEEEISQLRSLYEQYKEFADPIKEIQRQLDVKRGRSMIKTKLLELELISSDRKDVRMNEEEISQLKSLYEQYKDSTDPMKEILGRLGVKRSRNMITRKLLELNLIKDRKDLRKKRESKSGKSAKELEWPGDRSDDESIYDSWSDEKPGSSDEEGAPKPSTSGGQHPPESSRLDSRVNNHLMRVVKHGEELREALTWLRQCLEEALDDLHNGTFDDDEGVALLPLNKVCTQAMEHPVFIALLQVFQFRKPSDQERYWRIPGNWSVENITQRIDLIKMAFDDTLGDSAPAESLNELPEPSTCNTQEPGPSTSRLKEENYRRSKQNINDVSGKNKSSISPDNFDNPASQSKEGYLDTKNVENTNPINTWDNSDSMSSSDEESQKTKKRQRILSNSENENETSPAQIPIHTNSVYQNLKKNKMIIESDSEDDDRSSVNNEDDSDGNKQHIPGKENCKVEEERVLVKKRIISRKLPQDNNFDNSASQSKKEYLATNNFENTNPINFRDGSNSVNSAHEENKKTKKRQRILSDSEDENETSPSHIPNSVHQNWKKNKMIIESDSDDDEHRLENHEDNRDRNKQHIIGKENCKLPQDDNLNPAIVEDRVFSPPTYEHMTSENNQQFSPEKKRKSSDSGNSTKIDKMYFSEDEIKADSESEPKRKEDERLSLKRKRQYSDSDVENSVPSLVGSPCPETIRTGVLTSKDNQIPVIGSCTQTMKSNTDSVTECNEENLITSTCEVVNQ